MSSSAPRILVIEDDLDIRDSLDDLLTGEGYEVRLAENGALAVAALQDGYRPQVILLDYRMPVMGGPEFLAVRSREGLGTAPVIAFSAGSMTSAPGTFRTLTKPVDVQALLGAIAECLMIEE